MAQYVAHETAVVFVMWPSVSIHRSTLVSVAVLASCTIVVTHVVQTTVLQLKSRGDSSAVYAGSHVQVAAARS